MRFKQKLDSFIWFIIYTMPFWIAGFTAVANMGNTTGIKFADISDIFIAALPNSGVIYTAIKACLDYLGASGDMYLFMCGYITYLVIAHFAFIVENVLVFFVHMAERLIEKFEMKGRD